MDINSSPEKMNTKIVYVLTSDCDDLYLEQLLLSLHSLRMYNPECEVIVLVDEFTKRSISGKREIIYDYSVNLQEVPIPPRYDKMQRSRYIKLKVRELCQGNIIYLDNDTIICSSLQELDGITDDICAVRDMNRYYVLSEEEKWGCSRADVLGQRQELLGNPYFNGGVIFSRDTDSAHQLYRLWFEYWEQGVNNGLNTDQTPLCRANKDLGCPIVHFADKWNCQIMMDGKKYAEDAKIIHYYFNAGECRYALSSKSLLQSIKDIGSIPFFVNDFLKSPKRLYATPHEIQLIEDLDSIRGMMEQMPQTFVLLKRIVAHILGVRSRYLSIKGKIIHS